MAKRSKTSKPRRPGSEKVRVELRLDGDVHEALRTLAEEADISLNRLVNGVCRWAAEHGHAGEPEIDPKGGEMTVYEQEGCVWFGREPEPGTSDRGSLAFWLDFSGRQVVREGPGA